MSEVPSTAAQLSLSALLTQVSQAVIDAQEQLNTQSAAYNQQLPAGVPPAHFAIPVAHADLRMGFRNLSAKGMDVVLFSSKEERESYGESSVSFDLVATPPPPGSGEATDRVTGHRGVARSVGREAVLGTVESLVHSTSLHPSTKRSILSRRESAVIARLDEERVLVLWPSTPQGDAESTQWNQMSVFVLKGSAFDSSLFDGSPPDGFLRLAPRNVLLDRDPKQLADLVEALGDLLLALARRCDER
ncbi:MAG: hypothetical protein JNL98_06880 [Bryobacterales bacterium]|nr:hypothetical protein [Bryobacterales bacterium]